MSAESRSLPQRPSLRFLKLEARRRLDGGEFPTLHDAQLAIAREHGMSSWAVLKQEIERRAEVGNHALEQVRWLVTRFRDADGAGWQQPAEQELCEHLTERFLAMVSPERVVTTLARRASRLREELVLLHQAPLEVRAEVGGMHIEALAEAGAGHRLSMLRVYPVGGPVSDTRAAAPPAHQAGDVPAGVSQVIDEAMSELGLPGLVLARRSGDEVWAIARGYADLDRGEPMRPDHGFPACSVTKLITATAVLRLAAEGRVRLDDAANDHLRTVRLADGAVTVRDLLAHTGGVDSPAQILAGSVPDLVSVTGPVLACSGERGTFQYSNGGYGALGQLIADVSGSPYAQAATGLVLEPLGMAGSSFPVAWPGTNTVTAYRLEQDGTFASLPGQVCTVPAAGGLWTTATDLFRFALSWRSLLPEALAREALTPQADRTPAAGHMGLGWLLGSGGRVAAHTGGIPGASVLLVASTTGGRACVAFANRRVPMEPVVARMLRAIA